MNSSKELYRFLDAKADRRRSGYEVAPIQTVLITRIRKIDESIGRDLVTAVVDTEEGEFEVLTFKLIDQDGEKRIGMDKFTRFTTYLVPWCIRVQTSPYPKQQK